MKRKIIISLTIIAALLLLIFGYNVMKSKAAYTPQQNLSPVIEIPDVGIMKMNEVTEFEKPVVALFYADWCTYCRRFMPEYGKVAKKYNDKYTFAVINCDYPEYADLLRDFHIMSFPTLFIIDKKLEHFFMLNIASTVDNEIFEEELNNYEKFRNKITLKQ